MIAFDAPVAVHLDGYLKPFFVNKALLASASPELAAHCSAGNELLISDKAFQILITWVLYHELEGVEQSTYSWVGQTSLAEAWNMGAEYNIPALQNAAMRVLVQIFKEEFVTVDTMEEAYVPDERKTKLQEALVTQLARDSLSDRFEAWIREYITERGMDKVPGFCLDLAMALTSESDEAGESLDIGDYLVHEPPPRDSDSDESLTDD